MMTPDQQAIHQLAADTAAEIAERCVSSPAGGWLIYDERKATTVIERVLGEVLDVR